MGRKKGSKMSQEQKDKISTKMKEWAGAKTCPNCGRRNAVEFYVTVFVCKYCKLITFEHYVTEQANKTDAKRNAVCENCGEPVENYRGGSHYCK